MPFKTTPEYFLAAGSAEPSAEVKPEDHLLSVAPGVAALPLGNGITLEHTLAIKKGLEAKEIECELTLHSVYPAGWSPAHAVAPIGSVVLFTHREVVAQRRQAAQALGKRLGKTIGDWKEIYHQQYFHNQSNALAFQGHSDASIESVQAVTTMFRPARHRGYGRHVLKAILHR